MWDQEATNVAIKAIGSVESDFRYDAINMNDPITLGVAQWYGTRAAGLLHKIFTDDPSKRDGMPTSLEVTMLAYPVFDPRWNNRYLSQTEANWLKPVLESSKDIQNELFSDDIAEYLDRAEQWGYDRDTMTKAVAFFCTMYHQAPARSLDVTRAIDWPPTLDIIYQGALDDPTLGQYRTRQKKAYDIIKAWDSSGVDGGEYTPTPNPEPDDPGITVPGGTLNRVSVTGDSLIAYFEGGAKVLAYPDGHGNWIARDNEIGGGTVPPHDPNPDDPGPVEPGVWVTPVANNRCTNRFGYLSYGWHSGIDLGGRTPGVAGDTIRAINNGRVVTRGYHGEVLYLNSGRGLMLDHGVHDGVRVHSYYGHLSDWLVSEGDEVVSGQAIAKMGGTGATDSNTDFTVHLHMCIILDGTITEGGMTTTAVSTFTDPESFLRARGVFDGMPACPYN